MRGRRDKFRVGRPGVAKRWTMLLVCLLLLAIVIAGRLESRVLADPPPQPRYHSPFAVAFSPDGKRLAVTDHTAAMVAVLDASQGEMLQRVSLQGQPTGVVWTNSNTICVGEYGAGTVAEVDADTGRVRRRFQVGAMPMDLAFIAARNLLLVTDFGLGKVVAVDLQSGRVRDRLHTTGLACGMAVAPKGDVALVGNLLPVGDARSADQASVLDLLDVTSLKMIGRVKLPAGASALRGIAISPDGRWGYAVHTLGRYSLPTTQVERGWVNTNAVSIIDLSAQELYATLLLDRLTVGAADPWDVKVSPDGRTLWVSVAGTHEIARVRLAKLHGALAGHAEVADPVLVDDVLVCAGVDRLYAVDADDRRLVWAVKMARKSIPGQFSISLTSVDGITGVVGQDGRIYRPADGKPLTDAPPGPPEPAPSKKRKRGSRSGSSMGAGMPGRLWTRIARDPTARAELSGDMSALYGSKLIERRKLPANGLRGLSVSPDGRVLAAAAYFSGRVLLLDTKKMAPQYEVALGPQPPETPARRGEKVFHDATYCFQTWLSCATCHPDGRADGLNWDLLNDGIGNAKNAKSMVWSHKTPPVMSLGVRDSSDVAAAAGFKFIEFQTVGDEDLTAVRRYLQSLTPATSPYLQNGRLSALARRGKAIFEDSKTGCAACHPAPLYTTCRSYDVGTQHEADRTGTFDTPTLVELWRTAPYLHDGSAATLKDVLTDLNEDDKHGRTSHLSQEEIEALVMYLNSL